MEHTFLVGFADVIITPDEPIPLGGFGASSHRFHNNVLEDIHAVGTVMTDAEGSSVLFITVDTTRAYNEAVPQARQMISEATGLPVDRIMVTCTHTHSGPDMTNTSEPAIQRYIPKFQAWLVECAQTALGDRKPAKMFVGDGEVTGLSFIKHYVNTAPDGTLSYFGDGFGVQKTDETTRHVIDVFDTMHLVQFRREGGKDVVIVNWRAHPTLTGGGDTIDLSADYPGPFRQVLAAQLDCHVHFIQGAGGNVNPKSRIRTENYTADHRVHGARLAYFAIKALEMNMRPMEPGPIRDVHVEFAGKCDHRMDHMAEIARELCNYFNRSGDRDGARAKAKAAGFNSIYHAASVVSKAKAGATMDLELHAIAVGDGLAFVTAPNELFTVNSQYTEAHSPFAMTLTCGYANQHWFYLPYQWGYAYDCYESNVSRFAPGTAEEVSEEFLKMLNQLK